MPGRKHRRPHPHCHRGQQGGARRLELKAPPIAYQKDEQQRQQELGLLGRWVLVGGSETQNDFRSRHILKRLLIHVSGFNLSLIMRKLLDAGAPRGFSPPCFESYDHFTTHPKPLSLT